MKILYFAWLRNKVGTGEETVHLPDGVKSVGDLVGWLVTLSTGHKEAFASLGIVRVAVNQEHVSFAHPVKAGDEVAFFPPVTGG